jgi:transposase
VVVVNPRRVRDSARATGRLAKTDRLAGLDRDSGAVRGRRTTRGGRAGVRAALFTATVAAARHNPVAAAYRGLLGRGKPAEVALVACMRKMLPALNPMLRTGKA